MWTPTAARTLRPGAVLLPVLLAALLAGCSAGWKAPMESRGDGGYRGHQAESRPAQPIRASRYRVRRGDTLYSIAWRAGQDFRSLARWNGIGAPYTIYPGQVLRLSPPATTAKAAPKPRPQQAPRAVAPTQRSKPQATAKATTPERSDASLHWRWPANGPVLVRFSNRDATRKGIKIGGTAGQAIRAAEAGRVVYSGSGLIGYGQLIIIKHNDNYLTAYGHNAKLLVKEGEQVARGRHIADMGRSNDGQPMLHFEMRREGRPVDPLALLPRR